MDTIRQESPHDAMMSVLNSSQQNRRIKSGCKLSKVRKSFEVLHFCTMYIQGEKLHNVQGT